MKRTIARLTVLGGLSFTMGGCPFLPPPASDDTVKFIDLVSQVITTDECQPPVEVNGLDLKFPERADAFEDLLAQFGISSESE